ncbi:MAG: response regulator transcription factor [Rhodospirillaceae bacterium]
MATPQFLSKAVLSLDDDVEVCALLEHLLWPHRVIGVAHAYVALELIAREAFDLFILDVRLPDMDGLELCRRIRRDDPNVPVIICSGAATPADELAAMRAGASAYYAKPFEPESFQAGVERLLYAADDRNRVAEALVRQVMDDFALATAFASVPDDDESATFPLEQCAYRRFIEAGGTRAHFLRTWPTMVEKRPVAAPSVHAIPRVAGG